MCLTSSWLLRSLRFGYKDQDFNNYNTVDSLGDTPGGKFSDRNGKSSAGYEIKKLFWLSTSEIVCNYANVKFLKWPHEPAATRKFSCSHPVGEWFFLFSFIVMSLYIMWVTILDEVSAIARERKKVKCCAGGHESVRNGRSLFQSSLYAFRRGAGFCSLWQGFRNSEMSAGRHSTVFRNLKETRQSSYIENILARRIEWRQASAHTEVLEIDKLY